MTGKRSKKESKATKPVRRSELASRLLPIAATTGSQARAAHIIEEFREEGNIAFALSSCGVVSDHWSPVPVQAVATCKKCLKKAGTAAAAEAFGNSQRFAIVQNVIGRNYNAVDELLVQLINEADKTVLQSLEEVLKQAGAVIEVAADPHRDRTKIVKDHFVFYLSTPSRWDRNWDHATNWASDLGVMLNVVKGEALTRIDALGREGNRATPLTITVYEDHFEEKVLHFVTWVTSIDRSDSRGVRRDYLFAYYDDLDALIKNPWEHYKESGAGVVIDPSGKVRKLKITRGS